MKFYKLPEETLISLLRYLAGRPYGEVAEGVEMLKNLEPLPDETPKA